MPSLTADLLAAARIGADPRGGVSRFAWTPELTAANDWLAERLAELGLEVELDPARNVVGRWQAGEGKAILIGSHLDTVPNGGRYDGALGVLAALDVVRRLKAEGVEPRRPLWVVSFNDEEGGRFQTGMLGSRASAATATWRTGAAAASPRRWPRWGSTSPGSRTRAASTGWPPTSSPHRAGPRARAGRDRSRRRHGDHGDGRLSRPLPRRGQPCGHDAMAYRRDALAGAAGPSSRCATRRAPGTT